MTVLFFIILKLFNMESTIISYSNKKNIYLYDINLSLSILIHPKLEKVIKIEVWKSRLIHIILRNINI